MAKILIIDDDQDIIDSLSMILDATGHEVEARTDADTAVADACEVGPDLIILDVMFPDDPQAGFRAARALRQDERARRIPVLVLSAVNQRSKLAFSFSEADISDDFMPVSAFMDKPIEPRVLLAKIDQLLA